ncbi:hypothetical protein VTO73DRAFT_13676 [Trametes versicolor]
MCSTYYRIESRRGSACVPSAPPAPRLPYTPPVARVLTRLAHVLPPPNVSMSQYFLPPYFRYLNVNSIHPKNWTRPSRRRTVHR